MYCDGNYEYRGLIMDYDGFADYKSIEKVIPKERSDLSSLSKDDSVYVIVQDGTLIGVRQYKFIAYFEAETFDVIDDRDDIPAYIIVRDNYGKVIIFKGDELDDVYVSKIEIYNTCISRIEKIRDNCVDDYNYQIKQFKVLRDC